MLPPIVILSAIVTVAVCQFPALDDFDLLERRVLSQRANRELQVIKREEELRDGQALPHNKYVVPLTFPTYDQSKKFPVESIAPHLPPIETGPKRTVPPAAQPISRAMDETLRKMMQEMERRGGKGEELERRMNELRERYNRLKSKWQRKMNRLRSMRNDPELNLAIQRHTMESRNGDIIRRAHASKTAVAVEPMFIDLDDLEKFSDISYQDLSESNDGASQTTVTNGNVKPATMLPESRGITVDDVTTTDANLEAVSTELRESSTTTHGSATDLKITTADEAAPTSTETTTTFTPAETTRVQTIPTIRTTATTTEEPTFTTDRATSRFWNDPNSFTDEPLVRKEVAEQSPQNHPKKDLTEIMSPIALTDMEPFTPQQPPMETRAWTETPSEPEPNTPEPKQNEIEHQSPFVTTGVKSTSTQNSQEWTPETKETNFELVPVVQERQPSSWGNQRFVESAAEPQFQVFSQESQRSTEAFVHVPEAAPTQFENPDFTSTTEEISTPSTTTMDPLWWTPKPSYLEMSSIPLRPVEQEHNSRSREAFQNEVHNVVLSPHPVVLPSRMVEVEEKGAWPTTKRRHLGLTTSSRWNQVTRSMVLPLVTPSPLQYVPFRSEAAEAQPSEHQPTSEIYGRSRLPSENSASQNSLNAKLRKVAEQKVLNELEVLATSVNLEDLSRELRGENDARDAFRWDIEKVERELAAKKRALQQLEILNDLHNRGEQFISPDGAPNNHIRGSKIQLLEFNDDADLLASSTPADIRELDDALSEIQFFEREGNQPATIAPRKIPQNVQQQGEKKIPANVWSPQPVDSAEQIPVTQPPSVHTTIRVKQPIVEPEDLNSSADLADLEEELEETKKKLHKVHQKTRSQSRARGNRKLSKSRDSFKRFIASPPKEPQRTAMPPPPPSDVEFESIRTLYKLLDVEKTSTTTLNPVLENDLCSKIECSFENGDLCGYESSYDETSRKQKLGKRTKRSNAESEQSFYTMRAWSNWVGIHNYTSYRIDRAPVFVTENQRFAGVFLDSQQLGTLSIKVSSPSAFTVRLLIWEATRGMRLRVCCDSVCPIQTEEGITRGHKRWRRVSARCPAETKVLSFECINGGSGRGACGVDDVFVDSTECLPLFEGKDDN